MESIAGKGRQARLQAEAQTFSVGLSEGHYSDSLSLGSTRFDNPGTSTRRAGVFLSILTCCKEREIASQYLQNLQWRWCNIQKLQAQYRVRDLNLQSQFRRRRRQVLGRNQRPPRLLKGPGRCFWTLRSSWRGSLRRGIQGKLKDYL